MYAEIDQQKGKALTGSYDKYSKMYKIQNPTKSPIFIYTQLMISKT